MNDGTDPDDLELECRFVLEAGNACSVAGDLLVGAPRRLRAARTPGELAALRAQLGGGLRRTLYGLAIAVVLLERDGKGGSVKP